MSTLWERIKQNLESEGVISHLRGRGMAEASDAASVVEILRKEMIEERHIGRALMVVCQFQSFDLELTDDVIKQSVRGYTNSVAWIIYEDAFYSTNPLVTGVYKEFTERLKEKDCINPGFLSYETSESDEFKRINLITENSADSEDAHVSYDELIDSIIIDCLGRDVTDIHFGLDNLDNMEIKQRIHGALVPFKSWRNIEFSRFSRLVWARCDGGGGIHPRERQDGRFTYKHEGNEIEFRVSRAPETVRSGVSDRIVLRVLRPNRNLRSLTQFGLDQRQLDDFEYAFSQDAGLILATGPTGSGKSTFLQAGIRMAREVNPTRNFMAIEDPVEVQLEGVRQFTVTEDFPFGEALKCFLRQDPDVIFVGEIRDEEIAEMSLQAAATGHLILSTLHANDAHGVLQRLVDLGLHKMHVLERTLLFSAQRLVIKLCGHCKVESDISKCSESKQALYRQLLVDVSGGSTRIFQRNKMGCVHCDYGYSGRVLLIETLRNSARLVEWVESGRTMSEFRRRSIADGSFFDLGYRAMQHVVEGNIEIEKVGVVSNMLLDRPHLEAAFQV